MLERSDRVDGAPSAAQAALPARPARQRGFTLIELMIGTVVAMLLIVQAVPSYKSFVLRTRRADAKVALLNLQVLQERYRMSNASYATLAQLGAAAKSPQGHYDLAVTSQTATAYSITATAAAGSSQADDLSCRVYSINQDGPDRSTAQAAECWK